MTALKARPASQEPGASHDAPRRERTGPPIRYSRDDQDARGLHHLRLKRQWALERHAISAWGLVKAAPASGKVAIQGRR